MQLFSFIDLIRRQFKFKHSNKINLVSVYFLLNWYLIYIIKIMSLITIIKYSYSSNKQQNFAWPCEHTTKQIE